MKYVLLIGMLTCSFAGWSQTSKMREDADRYFQEEQFNLAIQLYGQLANGAEQNAEVNYKLAESYRKIFDYKNAEAYYLKVHYQAPDTYPLALYYYALMLKLNGAFAESIVQFDQFIKTPVTTAEIEQAAVDRAGSEMALAAGALGDLAKNESINSVYNDYAPAIRDSMTMVITSGRLLSNRSAIDERYGEGFTDNFYFVRSHGAWTDRTRQEFAATNSRFNDGSGCFSQKGGKYYFTICGKDGPECRIYVSRFQNNQWSEPVVLNDNVNVPNYESRHPALSPGGDTLLFATNRPGGLGLYDIWVSRNAGGENWGPATNLGTTVNTKLNELAPAFTRLSNVFFFASDGHQNYGGLDLYMAKRFSNGKVAVYNLDAPYNSNRDDCFLTFAPKAIYFSSNRENGKGGFDIYSAPIQNDISFFSRISLKHRGAREDVKLNGRRDNVRQISLLAARNEDRIEYENLTYEKQKIVDRMVANQKRNIPVEKSEFANLTQSDFDELSRIAANRLRENNASQNGAGTVAAVRTPAENGRDIVLTALLKDSASGTALADVKVMLVDDTGEILTITRTNEDGKFRFTDLPPGKNVTIRVAGDVDARVRPVTSELLVTSVEKMNSPAIEDIYFDFDHYSLRPEARLVLDDLANYLKKNPSVQVEIHAFADNRGPVGYNFQLTQKRGQAVLNYLTQAGADQTSMAVIAKGKQPETPGQDDIMRQLNRRVEFYFNGVKGTEPPPVATYIVKAKTSWTFIAKATGISLDKLIQVNGRERKEVQLFEPVRIPSSAKTIPYSVFYQRH